MRRRSEKRRSGGRRRSRGRGQEEWKGIDDIQMSLQRITMLSWHGMISQAAQACVQCTIFSLR